MEERKRKLRVSVDHFLDARLGYIHNDLHTFIVGFQRAIPNVQLVLDAIQQR
jgi:hypothetical protein